jgi:hypothetical protein
MHKTPQLRVFSPAAFFYAVLSVFLQDQLQETRASAAEGFNLPVSEFAVQADGFELARPGFQHSNQPK